MQPHWGKNPFSDPSTTPETTGGYELFITKNGNMGFPNEIAMPGSKPASQPPCQLTRGECLC